MGEVLLNRLDITLLQKPGKRVRNIEFAALCQMSQICDTTLPIEEQEYPAFPARELTCKCLRRCGRDNPENKTLRQKLFPVLEILSFSLFSFSYSIMIRNMAGEERHQNVLIPHHPHALCLFRNKQRWITSAVPKLAGAGTAHRNPDVSAPPQAGCTMLHVPLPQSPQYAAATA